jgi:transposase
VTRPSMRVVPIKSTDQQALLMLHRTRDLLIRQRTQLINALRAHLAEFGLVAEKGREGLAELSPIIADEMNREALPSAMKQALQTIVDQLATLELQIGTLDRAIHAHHRANDMSCRLETVPGIGVIGATALASTVTDPSGFKTGRDFAAWIGLVPRFDGWQGTARRHLEAGRSLYPTVARHRCNSRCSTSPRQHPQKHPWIMKLLAKKPAKLIAVAVANKRRASLGRSWSGEDTIERRRSLQLPEELGNGSVKQHWSKTIELRG